MQKIKKIGYYLPIQKSLKILPNISSTSTFPTIIPKCLVANLKSSAALSKSSIFFFWLKLFKWSKHCCKCCLCLSLVIKISSLVINLFFKLFFIFIINSSIFLFSLIEIKKLNHVLISIKENLNIDELILKIKNNLKNKFITSDDILITRERHRQHLEQCLEHLKNFNKKNEVEDFDKAAEDLRLATRHLGMIVGKVDVEEILGSIFNDFCIGK